MSLDSWFDDDADATGLGDRGAPAGSGGRHAGEPTSSSVASTAAPVAASGAPGVVHLAGGGARALLLAAELGPRRPVVDGYEVGEELGSGGSGSVWAGTGPDGQRRALKVLHPDTALAGGTELLRELSLLRRVRHPRLVAVHDISRDAQGRPVLVLDLAAGGSLAGLLRSRRRLGAAEVVGLLTALGPALEELHAAGVVHGDLSPGNVLLDARGGPLLADLGVARALGRRPGSVLGTPGFSDPAALTGGSGAAGDVYGLAAVCWCALTGAPPPAGRRGPGRPKGAELPPGTSQDLLAVLRRGLHAKPSRRPTPGELAEAAAACARPRPLRLPAGPPSAGPVDGLAAHRVNTPLPGPRTGVRDGGRPDGGGPDGGNPAAGDEAPAAPVDLDRAGLDR
ncbi:protein kinase, partial [Kineococcus sp. R8]|uniref:protein kinase domain-containing protein n=1 Tax=Kineococcus siccus TaxID=2696567 RepID=UPI0014126F32|nr:protein kinase [Kineococcus siccus]